MEARHAPGRAALVRASAPRRGVPRPRVGAPDHRLAERRSEPHDVARVAASLVMDRASLLFLDPDGCQRSRESRAVAPELLDLSHDLVALPPQSGISRIPDTPEGSAGDDRGEENVSTAWREGHEDGVRVRRKS